MPQKKITLHLEKLITLVEKEKAEDLAQYLLKTQDISLVDRRKEGICWYPVQLGKTSFSASEQLIVQVTRPNEHTESHSFQTGKSVRIFSTSGSNTEQETFVTGIVNFVRKNEMSITINESEFPDWLDDGKLGVQQLFDERTYFEMQKTLNFLLSTKEKRISELKNILLGDAIPYFHENFVFQTPKLNTQQNKALNLISAATDVAIIHGPPGTGKTTTIVQAAIHLLKSEKQLLICAPSNAAVDLLAEKLAEQGADILRLGHPARVNDKILDLTLDVKITKHHSYKELKLVRKQTEAFYKKAKKFKRNFGQAERQERKALFAAARNSRNEAKQLSFFIVSDIINKAQIITSTLMGASSHEISDRNFNTIFIDEAAQALEPATWIPILKANRVIFAGDHNQLPPTVKSFEAAKEGLEITLFEKIIKKIPKAAVMLEEQYRMNEKIMQFSSHFFYKGKLFANQIAKNRLVFNTDLPVEFIDTAGCGFFEQQDKETKSTSNAEECTLLYTHFSKFIEEVERNNQLANIQDIGIISPYRAQVKLLQNSFKETITLSSEAIEIIPQKLTINTIDSFQGQERDIMYISLVRSNEEGNIGFLADIRRMNVAMTRARKKLVVVGDSATISQHPFYANFLDYVNEIGAYRSAYVFMY